MLFKSFIGLDRLSSPPDGSVLSGRQHPADSLHLHESHQYDNHNIGLYIRIL